MTMHLMSGHTQSCGCKPRQNSDRVADTNGKMVRPDGYWSWKAIQNRCYTKSASSYHKYGGRGIKVCDRWLGPGGLANFLSDMGPRPSKKHSVGRNHPDANYGPDSCKWETAFEQGQNKRNARMLTLNGRTQSITTWNRELGLAKGGLHDRLRKDWTVERALSTPGPFRVPAPAGIKPTDSRCVNQGPIIVFGPGGWLL